MAGFCNSLKHLHFGAMHFRRTSKISTRGTHVRDGSKTVLTAPKRHFRSTPINGHRQTGPVGPIRAMKRHMFPTGIYLASSVAKKSCTSKTERCVASGSYLTQWP